MSVYAIDSSVPVQPLPLLPLHTPVDCVADDANNRAMTRVEMPWIEGPVYVERCLDECFRLGYGKSVRKEHNKRKDFFLIL